MSRSISPYLSHPCTPDIPERFSVPLCNTPTSFERFSGPVCNTPASFERFPRPSCNTPGTVDTALSSRVSSAGGEERKNASVVDAVDSTDDKKDDAEDDTKDEEMFCTDSQIWLDSSTGKVEKDRKKTERKSQSLSSYKLLQDLQRANKKSARKQILSCMKQVNPKQVKKFSRSKFLSVNGWNVDDEKQSLLQSFEDCVYMDESKSDKVIFPNNRL